MTLNLQGRNRFVFLIGHYAIKIPSLRSWGDFLHGLINNRNEAALGRSGNPHLCPILYAAPGGWLLVMPRANPLPTVTHEADAIRTCYPFLERKPDSYGTLHDGRTVALDYGWPHA